MTQTASRVIALVRILTGGFFVLFGEYKLASPVFAHEGFAKYLSGYIQTDAVRWYAPVLQTLVLPHAVGLGYFVGGVEVLIGLSLVLGWFVRPLSVVGALYMLNLTLATWWGPGHDAPPWQYFGAELDHLPLLFLFLIFFAAHAGEVWGLDGLGRRRRDSASRVRMHRR